MSTKQWELEKLYFQGDSYYSAALNAIRNAQKEITLESYIFDLDPIGLKFIDELHKAHQRKIKVRMLIDGIGSFNWIKQLKKICHEKGIALRIYHPLPFFDQTTTFFSWKSIRRLLFLFRRINKRNHRKVITIDGRHAFVGSFNISQVHSEKLVGDKAWRDTGIEIIGNDVKELVRTFTKAWRLSFTYFKPRHFKRQYCLVRLNSNLRWRFSLQRDLKKRILKAKTHILIANAYFIPRLSILNALKKAAKRGVYVGLCLPSRTDVWFTRIAARSCYVNLIKAGAHIYEYQPSVLHAKTIMIDDFQTVGSQNLNHRSLLHDLEVEIVVSHEENKKKMLQQWEIDITDSKKIDYHDLKKFTLTEKALALFISLFWYWI